MVCRRFDHTPNLLINVIIQIHTNKSSIL